MLYKEEFPIGSTARIAERKEPQEFKASWKYHHPLEEGQLHYAGGIAIVAKVGFYHGGDVLYQLQGVPGTWHESCLRTASRVSL